MNATSIFHAPTLLVLLVSVLSSVASARASVVINSTRIVYPQNDKEVTVRLESKNQAPVLIQAWLDDGDENATPDLTAEFPAVVRTQIGWQDVALECYQEMGVPGALQRCIRLLIHWNTRRSMREIVHVYVRGAEGLRPDRVKSS